MTPEWKDVRAHLYGRHKELLALLRTPIAHEQTVVTRALLDELELIIKTFEPDEPVHEPEIQF
jgi:hypothetical protein